VTQEREHPLEKARELARRAVAGSRGGDPEQALDTCDHALALLLPVGASEALADVLRWKGTMLRDRGDLAAAQELYAQSLSVADAVAYPAGRAHALNCLGTVAQFRGDSAEAERHLGEAARLAHRLANRRLSALVQQNLGILAEDQGRTDEAIAHFRLALVALEQEDHRDAALWVLNNLGVLYTREGATARALDVLDRALALAEELGDVASQGIVEENRAALFVTMNRLDQAELAATRAFGIAEQRGDNVRRAAALRGFARVVMARTPLPDQGVVLLERARDLSEMGEDALVRIEVLLDLGDAYRAVGETTRARESWRRGLDLARRAGYTALASMLQARMRPSVPVTRPDAVRNAP
jgi:tetratricopeptide (TPR) repeat protein